MRSRHPRNPLATPAFALLLSVAATGPGCADGPNSSQAETPPAVAPQRGGELHVMLESPGTLDPSRVDDVYESCIANQVYDGLLEFDANLHPVPCIAKEWTVSRDGREYVFTLRDDVRFHNGRAVVASDFVYSISRIVDPHREDRGIAGDFLRKIEGVDAYAKGEAPTISGLVALDERRVSIRLVSPYASFLSILAMDQTKIIPREEVERLGEDFARFPVGTGPFRMVEPTPGRGGDARVVVVANEDSFRGRPYLDRVVFHTISDYNTDRTAEGLLDGTLGLTVVPSASFQKISTDPRFKIVRRTELSFAFLGLNHSMKPFDDPLVRRAFAHSIDLARVAAADATGRIAATGILPPGIFGFSPERKGLAYDPDLSRRYLSEAGFPNGNGIPPIVYWQSNRGEAGKRADAALAENFVAVGLPVEFRYVSWDEFDSMLMGHRMQAFGLSWIADLPDPDSILDSLFDSRGEFNFFEYANATVDSLLEVGTGLRASNDRADVYRDAEKLIIDDVAMVPLYHVTNLYALRRDLEGFVITPFGIANLQLEHVWIDASKKKDVS